MTEPLTIACIIPTYNGRQELERLLDSLARQRIEFDTFIVDSSSRDGTFERAQARCPNVLRIDSKDFNHGGTRQMMVERHPDYAVCVFLTQDAYLEDPDALAAIVRPFSDPTVGAVCGRQLPHLDAVPLAQHARQFNYPPHSQLKSLADAPQLGIKTAFMSNSFSAYRREALLAVGGFPNHVILSEDMYVAAKMLLAGWKVAYEGQACCRHSHNYSLKEEFRRYFDIGVFQAREPWIRQAFGGAGGEGLRYVKSELRFLGPRRVFSWPGSLLRNAVKLGAYKLGQQERHLPPRWKKKLGMYQRYWDGPFA
ncbi:MULTISPECIES: glycosyltransferase family 2 protein [Pseudomonas]|uniref:O antigen biosynthesis rhamnosyltransferase RfbN n=1 Tax=Pseudomonas lundensis TaxID=86185 RepID=A0AAX2HC26_9PSED|nr:MULTISPECIES: glycosyltransferase family 2 protein [Pseudomonas]NLU02449.1 glycosyltransferase family 2 protein [Pseudomonas lundensis]NMZ97534.1 glycosyltransferase family 2 protein [Pseudomonas lundensis]NNA12709.1 glycosyltransferase family 2 protein [Pseudomonas lundensis]NNA32176.1 glycosyltransferase family 2 protein [Pseudomonas lundensis]NNA41550.1 glycosyltransferase family 2 protein [Pseudomonas lundensis]